MSIVFEFVLLRLFVVFLFITMGCLIAILVVHPFVPKVMLRAYFKEPYFSATEIEIFTGFPLGYMRTGMFMRLAGFPSSGQKRGMTEAYKLAPRWFRSLSRILLTLFFLSMAPPVILILSLLERRVDAELVSYRCI